MNLDNEELKATKNRQVMELSKEEQEAIERINYIQDFIIENGQFNADVEEIQHFSKVLNLIQKQSKVIDEMAGYINRAYNDEEQFYVGFEKNICEKTKNPQSESSDCYVNIYVDNACEECIKQYFYRKVERR